MKLNLEPKRLKRPPTPLVFIGCWQLLIMSKENIKLKIAFPDPSQSFTYGVEYGRLLEKIERGDTDVHNNGFPVRIENKELLKNTCDEYGYIAIFGKEYYDEWIEFKGLRFSGSNN